MKTLAEISRTIVAGFFVSIAVAACGGGGGGSGSPPATANPPPPAAPALPTVALAAAPSATVNRTVPLSASVTAPAGVTITMVEFLVDGTVVGSATTSPYSFNWDTSAIADGDHAVTARATDNTARTATSDAVTFSVLNNPVIHVELSNAEVLPAIESEATGAGDLTFNLVTGAVTGGVTIQGLTATLAHIHRGFAGANGPVVVDFVQDAADPTRWNAIAGGMLSTDDIGNLLGGALYVNVHSAAHPAGEIRGQIKPANVTVAFSTMSNDQVVPAAPDAASGTVVATIDANASTATIHALTSAIVEPTEAHLHRGAAGENAQAPIFALTQAPNDPNHWTAERQTITTEQRADFEANLWYVDVHTTGAPGGAVRGQVLAAPPAPPPPPPPPPTGATLSQLQTTIFGPMCSGCHNGSGGPLPGAMNLSNTAASFAALVGVPSLEQPALQRVAPNDSANSYLVHKLEGASTITGSRMPLGGPFLDQATIDQVRSWIDAGAQNN